MATTNNPSSGSDSLTDANVERQFEEAIRNNNYNELKFLLDANNDLLEIQLQHEFDEYGSTMTLSVSPLILATALSHDSIVKLLLDYGASADAEVPELGGTALHIAARYGPKHTVDLLLSKDVDKNQQNQAGSSPLHLASEYNQLEVVRCLLDAQADLSQRNDKGSTPFHFATMYGHEEILRLLWDRGPSEQIHELNKYLNGPLHMACLNGHRTVVELLLDWGAKVDQLGSNGGTPLFNACETGNIAMINILAKRGANIHAKNNDGDTPILYSCWHSQPNSLDTLKKRGASVLDVNKEGRNCFHMVVLNPNASGDSIDVLSSLLDYGADINHVNNSGFSPLYIACIEENFKHSKYLLDLGADINQQSTHTRSTALMEACCRPSTEIVEMLLQRGADTTFTNNYGLNALALACRNNRLENVKALVRNGATVSVHDRKGYTPLYTAVINQNFDIALEILATPAYFPQNPAKERAFTERSTSIEDARRIESSFLECFKMDGYDKQAAQAILHWAISNGCLELARRCISLKPCVLQLARSGATWLHVAAQYGEHEIIEYLLSFHVIDVSAIAEGRITALHVAVANSSVETAQLLLQRMSNQTQQRAEAIISQDSQGNSPFTISIKQKHRAQQELFLDEFRQLGTPDKSILESNRELGSRILELLAEYETPGHEDVLSELLQKWFRDEHLEKQQNFTALHWAVHRSQAVVVWWLLSKGGYSSTYAIESAQKLVPGQYKDTDDRYHIKRLLLHPPPIRDQVANPSNEHITPAPLLIDEKASTLDIQGNIVDIYISGDTVRIPNTKASVRDIIYAHGPGPLMKTAEENWDLNQLKMALKLKHTAHIQSRKGNYDHSPDQHNDLGKHETAENLHMDPSFTARPKSSRPNTYEKGNRLDSMTSDLKLRWIHLPVNELNLMRDLVCRLSHDSKRLEAEHTVLMKHFDRSWTEVAAGGKRNYMKPQCVEAMHPNNRTGKNQPSRNSPICMALYMPYLTLGSYTGKHSTGLSHEESTKSRSSRQVKHEPMTIDQYYYPTIDNTDERDNDQVLSKFLDKRGKQDSRRILMVNQLWVWIIDEKTIITATTEDTDLISKGNLFRTILDKLLYNDTRSRIERAVSVQSVMELALEVAVGFFMDKIIPSSESDSRGLPYKKGPIEIFRESLRDVADSETRLFRDFLAGLNNEAMQQGGPQNSSHVISAETKLLDEIRDIRDELHILRSLAEDQGVVWKQAREYMQYYQSYTPTDVKKDLHEMLSEAERITEYITTLLDLRQAEYSRTQANDSAKLSNSIFIFTVITIVFLPLSFLSSLFALDISTFPHDESGDLKYQGWWLFPILFGVTIIVCIPAIALAWNVNSILGWFLPGSKRNSVESPASTDMKSDILSQQITSATLTKSLGRRWRRRDKNNLPRHEIP